MELNEYNREFSYYFSIYYYHMYLEYASSAIDGMLDRVTINMKKAKEESKSNAVVCTFLRKMPNKRNIGNVPYFYHSEIAANQFEQIIIVTLQLIPVKIGLREIRHSKLVNEKRAIEIEMVPKQIFR